LDALVRAAGVSIVCLKASMNSAVLLLIFNPMEPLLQTQFKTIELLTAFVARVSALFP
jgi:hypothetical protein